MNTSPLLAEREHLAHLLELAGDVLARIDAADRLAVSAISCWEVVHLHKRGRIDLGMDVSRWLDLALEGSDVECLPITRDIAAQAATLALEQALKRPVDIVAQQPGAIGSALARSVRGKTRLWRLARHESEPTAGRAAAPGLSCAAL